MTRHNLQPPPGFTKPPGTVRIIGGDGDFEDDELLLQPTPSDDPNDPLNWSMLRKCINFLPTLAITVIIMTQTSIQLVFWVLWVPEFDCTYDDLNAIQATSLTGMAIGSIIFIPSAVKYGRRSAYILMTAIIAATCIWTARVTTLVELYISGFIFGLACSTNETIVEMTIADLFFVHQRATANAIYMLMVMAGNYLTPIAAGYMSQDGDWRTSFWILFGVEVPLLFFFIFCFEESKYVARIDGQVAPVTSSARSQDEASVSSDHKKALEGGSPVTNVGTEDDSLRREETATLQASGRQHINPAIPRRTYRERMRLVTKTDESLFLIIKQSFMIPFRFPAVLYTGFTYAFSLCWIVVQGSLQTMIFAADPYNFDTVGIGNMNLPVFIGCLVGSAWAAFSDKTVRWQARRNYGYFEPEFRLHMNHLPALCMGGGFMMFGCTAAQGMDWIYPAVGLGIFGFGVGALGDIAICVLIDSYRALTGEAFISVAFLRNVFSIAFSFSVVPWLNAQGLTGMTVTQGLMAIVLALVYIPILIWGKRIRQRTAPVYAEWVASRGGYQKA